MRVFKPQSPMSVGAWTLAVFGTFAAAAAFAEMLEPALPLDAARMVGNLAEGISALSGLPFSNYTGVLIGASVIPVWNENVGTLPIHFGMSGLNSAVSILELMGHENRALNMFWDRRFGDRNARRHQARDHEETGDGIAEARPQRPDHAPRRCHERAGSTAAASCRWLCGTAPLPPTSPRGRDFQHRRVYVDPHRLGASRPCLGRRLATAVGEVTAPAMGREPSEWLVTDSAQ